MKFVVSLGVVVLGTFVLAGACDARSLEPLAYAVSLNCPLSSTTDTLQTETAAAGGTEAYFLSSTTLKDGVCNRLIELHIKTAAGEHILTFTDGSPFKFHYSSAEFNLVDISSDGQWLLLEHTLSLSDEFRKQKLEVRTKEFAVVDAAQPEIRWRNVWDILGWGNCNDNVQAEAFASDGKIIASIEAPTWKISLSRSIFDPPDPPRDRSNDCISPDGFYDIDLTMGTAKLRSQTVKFKHQARIIARGIDPCATSPYTSGACYRMHGRVSYRAALCTWYILPSDGGRRICVGQSYLPDSLADVQYHVDADADLYVCPSALSEPKKPEVCIESANNVRYKKIKR